MAQSMTDGFPVKTAKRQRIQKPYRTGPAQLSLLHAWTVSARFKGSDTTAKLASCATVWEAAEMLSRLIREREIDIDTLRITGTDMVCTDTKDNEGAGHWEPVALAPNATNCNSAIGVSAKLTQFRKIAADIAQEIMDLETRHAELLEAASKPES